MKQTLEVNCSKCNWKLMYFEPSHSMTHCGTDFWTMRGERRWKPKICMACRSKIGQHAKKEQDKQVALSYSRFNSKH